MLGRAFLGQRDYDNAISQLSQVTQARPSDGNAHYNLGQAHQAAGNDARAIAAYQLALQHLAAGSLFVTAVLALANNLPPGFIRFCAGSA